MTDFARGYFAAADHLMNFINSLDSSDMTTSQVRSAVYGHCLEMRPPMGQKPRLIALCSPAMGSGKSTVAEHLASSHNFVRMAFAAPLKAMTVALLQSVRMPADLIHRHVYGDLKEAEIPGLAVSSRRIQQTIGTEWGRQCIRESFWTDIAITAARQHLDSGRNVVIDDMRFPNEFDAITAAGGSAYRIVRPEVAVVGVPHASEGQLDGIAMPEIWNTGDRAALFAATDRGIFG